MDELTKVYFEKYKAYFIPICLILVAIFIVFQVALPQFENISTARQKIEEKEDAITSLQTTLNTLESTPDEEIASNKALTERALPSQKEIVTIFSTLTSVASRAQVDIEGFSLTVGGVYGKEKAGSSSQTATRGAPSLSITASVNAPAHENLITFSKELYQALPLAEVTKIETADVTADYNIEFFYKPYDIAQISKQDLQLTPLNEQERSLLQLLEGWKGIQ